MMPCCAWLCVPWFELVTAPRSGCIVGVVLGWLLCVVGLVLCCCVLLCGNVCLLVCCCC